MTERDHQRTLSRIRRDVETRRPVVERQNTGSHRRPAGDGAAPRVSSPPTNGRLSRLFATASCRNLEGRPRAPLAAYVDRQLLQGKTKGYRLADMPQPAEAWKRAFAALDEVARRAHGRPFALLTEQDQDAMLAQMAEGRSRRRQCGECRPKPSGPPM